MEFLIIFDTVEGQTGVIVEHVAKQINDAGHTLRTILVKDVNTSMSLEKVDKVILAAPVHERRHPKTFEDWITTNRASLSLRKTLLISVSLKAAFPECIDEAQDYVLEMEMRTGFTPNFEALTEGAIRSSSYGYFESQVIQDVVLEGREVDLVDGVREFTDWDKLSAKVAAFIAAPLDMNQ